MEYKNSFLNTKLTKSYNENVLIGNWIEDRFTNQVANPEELSAYNPCVKKTETEQSSEYKPYDNIEDLTNYTFILKNRNEKDAAHTKISFLDSDSFLKNYTTSNDLHYKYTPRTLCGPLPKYNTETKAYEPYPDYLASFGNLTNYGIRKYVNIKNFNDVQVSGLSETRELFKFYDKKYYKPYKKIKGPPSTVKIDINNYLE